MSKKTQEEKANIRKGGVQQKSGFVMKDDDLNFKPHPYMDAAFFVLKKSMYILAIVLMFSIFGIAAAAMEKTVWKILLSIVFYVPVFFVVFLLGMRTGEDSMRAYIKGLARQPEEKPKPVDRVKEFSIPNSILIAGVYLFFPLIFFVLGVATKLTGFTAVYLFLNFPVVTFFTACGLDINNFSSALVLLNLPFTVLPAVLYCVMYYVGGMKEKNQQLRIDREKRSYGN